MNRWFPRGAVVLGALALAGCNPNNSVKPGAPVLTQMIILQPGGMTTTITGSTPECAVSLANGDACLPQGKSDTDGGVATPPDTICHMANNDWCTCAAGMADPTMGTWSCGPFASTAGVIAIFDRLLSTAPFDAADGGPSPEVATLAVNAGTPAPFPGDYASNGSTTGLIIPLFSQYIFGNFRFGGPSILLAGDPELPSGSTLTVSLSKMNVTAKDGTAFTGEGLLQDGTITFNTAPFAASITTPPPAPTPDGGAAPTPAGASLPDNTPAKVAFTNFVNVADVMAHIHVTVGGTAVPVDIASMDNVTVTITPKTTWPPSSTIDITVDKDAADLLQETLGVAATATFMTTAM